MRGIRYFAFLGVCVFGQSVRFEVTSVKPTGSAAGEAFVQVVPGRLRMQNVAARTLVQLVYGVEGYQILGGPEWMASERFDIDATAEGSASTAQMQGPMLLALLEERFKLKAHRETRPTAVYELRVDRPKLKESLAGDCVAYRADAPPPSVSGARPNFCDFPHLMHWGLMWTLEGKGLRMADIARTLARTELERPVIDKTELTGTYDVYVVWWSGPRPEETDGISIFTALWEVLGLKLDPARAPAEVIVVDGMERPSGN